MGLVAIDLAVLVVGPVAVVIVSGGTRRAAIAVVILVVGPFISLWVVAHRHH